MLLRTHGITIECRTTDVSLESDREKSTVVCLPASGSEREVRILRHRTQRQKQKQASPNADASRDFACLRHKPNPTATSDTVDVDPIGLAAKDTEGMRAKLKRLVSRQILTETEPGLFALAPTPAA